MAQVESWRSQAVPTAVVIIPLLFETDAAQDLDVTVCVACSEALQQRRLAERGWTTDQIQQRIQAQMPVRRKIELADYVVWNCAGLDVLEAQLARILAAAEPSHQRAQRWRAELHEAGFEGQIECGLAARRAEAPAKASSLQDLTRKAKWTSVGAR